MFGKRKSYPSDLTDAEWERLKPLLPAPKDRRALELLYTAGFRKLKNLKGGLNAWARDVDPRRPTD